MTVIGFKMHACSLSSHTEAEISAGMAQVQEDLEKNGDETIERQPRYTPVSTLTRTYSIPKLVSECKCNYPNTLQGEDGIYSSPYQHLCAASMDYTSMYSKPHQYSDVTVAKPATHKNSSL